MMGSFSDALLDDNDLNHITQLIDQCGIVEDLGEEDYHPWSVCWTAPEREDWMGGKGGEPSRPDGPIGRRPSSGRGRRLRRHCVCLGPRPP